MDAEQTACLSCQTTKEQLGSYEFTTLLGQQYQGYFCLSCFGHFQDVMNEATVSQKVEYHENLAKIITGKA